MSVTELGIQIMSVLIRALLAGAVSTASVGAASAQIVPETSGKTSAANSPAAAVQTGFRRRLDCAGCAEVFPDRGGARTHSLRDAFPEERRTRFP